MTIIPAHISLRHLDFDYAEVAELHRCLLPYLGRAYRA